MEEGVQGGGEPDHEASGRGIRGEVRLIDTMPPHDTPALPGGGDNEQHEEPVATITSVNTVDARVGSTAVEQEQIMGTCSTTVPTSDATNATTTDAVASNNNTNREAQAGLAPTATQNMFGLTTF